MPQFTIGILIANFQMPGMPTADSTLIDIFGDPFIQYHTYASHWGNACPDTATLSELSTTTDIARSILAGLSLQAVCGRSRMHDMQLGLPSANQR